jgi:hypothetical protein
MYSEAQRRIFGPYSNGVSEVYADPIKVYRILSHELEGEPNRFIRGANSDDPQTAFESRNRLLAAAATALDMTAFDPGTGKGALESDVMAALNLFLEFMEKNAARGPNGPTWPQPTAPTSSAPTSLS